MSVHVYDPPKFIEDASGYSEYRRKLERWARITKVEKKQQAEVVLYHLEGHPSQIQEKIDTALGDKIVDKEDGLQQLITYLDSIYGEDDMVDAWSKYKKFVKLKKSESQPINEFIAEFERSYLKAKESGCEFSDTVLAFNLLEACHLSDTDEKFVLTAIDFKKGKEAKDLFHQVKNSLRKFQSREKLLPENNSCRFKVEDETYLIETVKEALVSEGWRPPIKSSNGSHNSSLYKGRKNPLGSDGRPLKCFNCQSEYHFLDKCDQKRDTKDKMKKTAKSKKGESSTMLSSLLNTSQETEFAMINHVSNECEEQLVLVANKEIELCCLLEDAGCRGVLDSACSKSVAGLKWIENYGTKLTIKSV